MNSETPSPSQAEMPRPLKTRPRVGEDFMSSQEVKAKFGVDDAPQTATLTPPGESRVERSQAVRLDQLNLDEYKLDPKIKAAIRNAIGGGNK